MVKEVRLKDSLTGFVFLVSLAMRKLDWVMRLSESRLLLGLNRVADVKVAPPHSMAGWFFLVGVRGKNINHQGAKKQCLRVNVFAGLRVGKITRKLANTITGVG
jgi:hypothetical protein